MRGAVVVRLIAAVLASVAVISGFVHLVRFTDADQLSSSAINDLRDRQPGTRALRFLVTATSLDPEAHTLNATVSMVPTKSDPEFAAEAVTITISNLFFGDVTVPYPLAGVHDTPVVNVAIPADVDPEDFPNDTYTVDLALYVSYPPGTFDRDPPIMVGMAADNRLGQWNLDTDLLAPDRFSLNSHRITAVLTRSWDYSAFVYTVSLMPAVIGLGFMVRRRGTANAAALELAAALLALIALRQVFVPANISGLTRLDILLGVQLALLCALMAAAHVHAPEPVPVTPTPPPPPARPAEHPAATNIALVVLVWLGFLLGRRRRKR